MTKLRILAVLCIIIISLTSCSNNETFLDAETDIVIKDFLNSDEALDSDKLTVAERKPYENGYLILLNYYGEGSEVILYYIEKNSDDFVIKNKTSVAPAISMGFAINKIYHNNNMILFSNLNESTWIPSTDERKETDYSKMVIKTELQEDLIENIRQSQDGYIAILPKTEIIDITLYNSTGEIVNTLKDLNEYGVLGEEYHW